MGLKARFTGVGVVTQWAEILPTMPAFHKCIPIRDLAATFLIQPLPSGG